MSKRLRFTAEATTHFVTFVVWKRTPLFRDRRVANLLTETVRFYARRGDIVVHAYVIMPDHVHLLLTTADGISVGNVIGRIKSYLHHCIKERHQGPQELPSQFLDLSLHDKLWVPRFDDIVIRNREMGAKCLRYIHENPVKKMLVQSSSKYQYSSAHFYETGELRPQDVPVVPLE